MSKKQKRNKLDKHDQPRKKVKSKSVSQDNFDNEVGSLDDLKPEFLDTKTIREGMVILGCITCIGKSSIQMSLPGCLYGDVEASNISDGFSRSVETSANSPDLEVPSIDSVVKLGMVLPCKVLKVEHNTAVHKKIQISLSVKPADINGNLKPSSIYSKMGLFVAVHSIEDHGYIIDVGTETIQGFLPKGNSHTQEELVIGQLIPVNIEKIQSCNKKSAKVIFYGLESFHQRFPEVSLEENIKLHSIMPGTKIIVDVIKKHRHYAIMKFFNYDACASLFYRGFYKHIQVGDKVRGTVLYISPVTRMIHLSLDDLPCPADFSDYFKMKKFDMIIFPKFLYFYKNQAIYHLHGKFGFINICDLPSKQGGMPTMPSLAVTDIQKARVIFLHYMDSMIQLTAKPSVLAQNLIRREDIKSGNVYDVTVGKHEAGGMFVHICPGVLGFVRKPHISDAYITKPERLYPAGSTVKCKVLHKDEEGKIYLTCKKSFIELDNKYILSSYWDARNGHLYKGVVVDVSEKYILVLFFNNVKGIVTREHMPLSSDLALNNVYFVGQTITCKVLRCIPGEQKLNLSQESGNLDLQWNYLHNPSSKKYIKRKEIESQLNEVCPKKRIKTCESNVLPSIADDDNGTLGFQKTPADVQCTSTKPSKAVIRKVKGHQLNIALKDAKGRVHITELGCVVEGIYPLKEFLHDQKIYVYTIGEFKQKRSNFLEVTHRNMTTFKECTLKFPPRPANFVAGGSVIGFVKEVHDIYATVWLSPTEFGVLDFLHYSVKPKVLRKLHQDLKAGLSLNVSILEIKQDSTKVKDSRDISLTKIDYHRPHVGKNILGLVQIACPTRGLIMKLPFGYHGNVSITDLTDIYEPVQSLLRRYQRKKFLNCHVLKVDHNTKYCLLSLRMSRMYQKKADCNSFCPEVTLDMLNEGDRIKGFVKHVSDSAITVLLGREIEGRVNLHACKKVKGISDRYPAGSVIDVTIQGRSTEKKFILSLSESKMKKKNLDTLAVEEDINFGISDSNLSILNENFELHSLDSDNGTCG